MIKNNNYITIQGWMINDLNLSGNDLIVYATIYGFTQDEKNWFEGSRQYLAEWCNSSRQGIDKNLKNLLDKNLIIKQDTEKGSVCKYKCNTEFFPNNKN
jgi:predicted transcriptional regulator